MGTLAWVLVLTALGLLLLGAEVFLPSGGLLGVAALGCLGGGVWLSFQGSPLMGALVLLTDALLSPLTVGLAFSLVPKTRLGGRLLLKTPRPDEVAVAHAGIGLDLLVGRTGRALTPLRPSGLVEFDGLRLDGLSECGLIPSGTPVRSVGARGGQVIVRAETDPPSTEPPG